MEYKLGEKEAGLTNSIYRAHQSSIVLGILFLQAFGFLFPIQLLFDVGNLGPKKLVEQVPRLGRWEISKSENLFPSWVREPRKIKLKTRT